MYLSPLLFSNIPARIGHKTVLIGHSDLRQFNRGVGTRARSGISTYIVLSLDEAGNEKQ